MKHNEKVMTAAKGLFLEKGFTGTTVRDIAQKAGVSSATVLYGWGSKEALYHFLFPLRENVKEGEKRDVILREAVRLFAQKGYHGASIRDIAQAAGVNSAAISYYFGGKKELYREIVERGSAMFAAFVEEAQTEESSPTSVLRRYGECFLRMTEEHPFALQIFAWEVVHPTDIFSSVGKERMYGILTTLRDAVRNGMKRGIFRKNLRLEETVLSWAGMVTCLCLMKEIQERYGLEESLSPRSYMEQAYEVFLRGVKEEEE